MEDKKFYSVPSTGRLMIFDDDDADYDEYINLPLNFLSRETKKKNICRQLTH